MIGLRLETEVLILSMYKSFIQDILKCTQNLSLSVSHLVCSPLALGEAFLSDKEKAFRYSTCRYWSSKNRCNYI